MCLARLLEVLQLEYFLYKGTPYSSKCVYSTFGGRGRIVLKSNRQSSRLGHFSSMQLGLLTWTITYDIKIFDSIIRKDVSVSKNLSHLEIMFKIAPLCFCLTSNSFGWRKMERRASGSSRNDLQKKTLKKTLAESATIISQSNMALGKTRIFWKVLLL